MGYAPAVVTWVAPLFAFVVLVATTSACGTPQEMPTGNDEKVRRIEDLYDGYIASFPEVPAVTAVEFRQRLADGEILLVDVRKPEEQEVSMIPGAMTREEFESRADELRGREVVTYCTIGYRSGLYAQELRAEGWDARNLRGSILSWTHAGGPLAGPDGPTRRVHVYGERWALAADGYEQVW